MICSGMVEVVPQQAVKETIQFRWQKYKYCRFEAIKYSLTSKLVDLKKEITVYRPCMCHNLTGPAARCYYVDSARVTGSATRQNM